MGYNLTGDQRRGGRGTLHGRRRWRLRPALLELEGRALLSTIVVNNPTDTPIAGKTDLRQAIVQANTNGGAETITFDKTVFRKPQTINLNPALGQLELSDQTGTEKITGPTAGVTVNGNYTSAGPANSVFKIDPGVTATLSGLTIKGGNNSHYGGGVDNQGTVTLIDCTVSGNTSNYSGVFNYKYGAGGGVFNSGTADLIGCTLNGNTAYNRTYEFGGGYVNIAEGGGVENSSTGSLTLTGCTVSGNSAGTGGGVGSYGTTTLTGCTISGNFAAFGGGGVANYSGTTTVTGCTISGNSAASGGGVINYFGTITLTNCTIGGNTATKSGHSIGVSGYGIGGGLDNAAGSSTLTLTNCTVSGNSAGIGGGVASTFYGAVTVTNCIISNNQATGVNGLAEGGGIFMGNGTLALSSSTLVGNTATGSGVIDAGGGGLQLDGASATVTNTTFLDNIAKGGAGGAGATGGDAAGGGIEVGYAASLDLSGGMLIGNLAQGGWAAGSQRRLRLRWGNLRRLDRLRDPRRHGRQPERGLGRPGRRRR